MSDKIKNIDEQEEELFEHYKYIADNGQDKLRIDKFLIDRIPNTSRSKIQIAAHNGNILVNKVQVKPNYKVKPKDEISIVSFWFSLTELNVLFIINLPSIE